jgi:hypothetical protein
MNKVQYEKDTGFHLLVQDALNRKVKIKGNITIRTLDKVLEALRLSKDPQSTYAISKLEQLNYNSVVTALNYLEQEGKVKQFNTSSGIFWDENKMNPADDYIEDETELLFTGKKIREYRDICRNEGYKQAIVDILNLPLKEFVGDYIAQIEQLEQEFYKELLDGELKTK